MPTNASAPPCATGRPSLNPRCVDASFERPPTTSPSASTSCGHLPCIPSGVQQTRGGLPYGLNKVDNKLKSSQPSRDRRWATKRLIRYRAANTSMIDDCLSKRDCATETRVPCWCFRGDENKDRVNGNTTHTSCETLRTTFLQTEQGRKLQHTQ